MNKEQILLAVSVGVAGLVVWSNLGQYEPVGVKGPWDGKDMGILPSVPYDVLYGLSPTAPGDRAYTREFRIERRDELPEIPAPGALAWGWVRPVPTPGPDPAFWSTLRAPIEPTKRAVKDGEDEAEDAEEDLVDEETADAENAAEALENFGKVKRKFDPDRAAQLFWSDGTSVICTVAPVDPDGKVIADMSVWTILEAWPNQPFKVTFLNKDGSRRGETSVGIQTDWERVGKVVLARSLLNDFHTQRIATNTRDTDRNKLIDLAGWTMKNLWGEYTVPATKLAIAQLEKAYALGADLALTKELGALYAKAYDPDGELALYQRFLKTKPNSPPALALVAGAMMRAGAYGPSSELFAQAAVSGDAAFVLGLAECYYGAGDMLKAGEQFEKVKGSANGVHRGHALEGLARIALRAGKLRPALTLAQEAVGADASSPDVNNTLGSCHYCLGQFDKAIDAYGKAAAIWGARDTTAHSNRGLAMIAAGRIEAAVVEFEYCLATDPLNYFAPLIGLGEAYQHWDEIVTSNDFFDTALKRIPNDPWALLRRATTRMRDGQGAQASELAKRALGVAPASVDAIRAVGLSAGLAARKGNEVDQELADTGVKYLEYAVAKETGSKELLYEECRALLMNGQVAKAARLLDAATDVKRGPYRDQAEVLALSSYAMFLGKQDISKVLEKISNVLVYRPSPGLAEWANAARGTIVEWDRTRIWEDDFGRQSASAVGNGWDEDESPGPRIALGNERCTIAGPIANEGGDDRNGTKLERTEDLKKFISAEASFKVGKNDEVCFHVYKGTLPKRNQDSKKRQKGQELGFGVHRSGVLMLYVSTTSRKAAWKDIVLKDENGEDVKWPDDGQFHTVTIVRTDDRRGIFQVFFDGAEITVPELETIEVSQLALGGKDGKVGFLVDGDTGHTVNTEIDYVRIKRKVGR